MKLPPARIIELLGLEQHSTCGFAREIYRSDLRVPAWARAEPSDVEAGNVEQLMASYPAARKMLAAFAS